MNLLATCRIGRMVVAASLLTGGACLGGCLVSGSSHEKNSGSFVGPNTFSQIEPGVTNQQWIDATLGKPDAKTAMDDGSEIWKWCYTKTRKGHGSVFLLLSSSNSKETIGTTFVQMRNGVVEKAWQD